MKERIEIELQKNDERTLYIEGGNFLKDLKFEIEVGNSLLGKSISIRVEDLSGATFVIDNNYVLNEKIMILDFCTHEDWLTWIPEKIILKSNDVESGFIAVSVRSNEALFM